MNERAREALVAASLKGVKQIRGALFDGNGGMCALAVLYQHAFPQTVYEWAGFMPGETQEIIYANDDLGWDFLTIARKCGIQETEND